MEKQDNWLIFFELEELKHKTRTATWTNFVPLGLHSGLPGCLLDAWRLRGMRGKSFTKIGNMLEKRRGKKLEKNGKIWMVGSKVRPEGRKLTSRCAKLVPSGALDAKNGVQEVQVGHKTC